MFECVQYQGVFLGTFGAVEVGTHEALSPECYR